MNIWHAPSRIAGTVNIGGYVGIVVGTLAGLAGYLGGAAAFANVMLIASPIAIAVGTLAVFWASGVQAIQADRAIATANATAEQAGLASLNAQVLLEQERQERIKLEQTLQDRSIDPTRVPPLVEDLKRHANVDGVEGRLTACVFSVSETLEAHRLADQIANVFASAGFTINRYPVMYGKSYIIKKVGILTSDTPEAIRRGEEIKEALVTAGVSVVTIPTRTAFKPQETSSRNHNLSVSLLVGNRL